MRTALLPDGSMVSAFHYNERVHGKKLYCIDKNCNAELIFVSGTSTTVPYFKTTGKSKKSRHSILCGFYRPLTFEEGLSKIKEYQNEYLKNDEIEVNVVQLNMERIDPELSTEHREEKQEKKSGSRKQRKKSNDDELPKTIGSLQTLVNLFEKFEPDILATIFVEMDGKKIPLSDFILSHDVAHERLWSGKLPNDVHCFVYGIVEQILRRRKVHYINFKPVNNVLFSLVLFEPYFPYFNYKDEQLLGKKVLAWGQLRKNTYNDKNTSEMIIKSNKYLYCLE